MAEGMALTIRVCDYYHCTVQKSCQSLPETNKFSY